MLGSGGGTCGGTWRGCKQVQAADDGIPPQSSASLGFENGTVSTGWEWGKAEYQAGTTDRLVAVDKNSIVPPSIDPAGTKALKVTVQPNDVVNNGARAEVVLTKPLPHKNTYYFLPNEEACTHWYTMFPSALTSPNTWHIWTQFHQQADSRTCRRANGSTFSPCFVVPMTFNLQNYPTNKPEPCTHSTGERIELSVINKYDVNDFDRNPWGKGYGDDILWSENLQKAHWYDMLLHVRWEPSKTYSTNGTCTNQNGGFVELWVDGRHVVNKTSHFTMDDDGTIFMKQGLYHCLITSLASNCSHINYSQTIYHDGMFVAECPSTSPNFHPATKKCYGHLYPREYHHPYLNR